MYGKLIDDAVSIAPKGVIEGYKPIVFVNKPEAPNGYYVESGWKETDEAIIQTWTLLELPEDLADKAEAYDILTGVTE